MFAVGQIASRTAATLRDRRSWSALAAVLALAACSDDPPADPEPVMCEQKLSLIDADLWTLIPAESDPFTPPPSPDGPAGDTDPDAGTPDAGSGDAGSDGGEEPEQRWGKGPCPAEEVIAEDLGGEPTLSIYTRRCSWATAEQPALVEVAAGDPLTIRIWRFSQTLTWVPEALTFVAVGEDRIWEDAVPLPAGSGILRGEFEAPFDIPPGAPIRWHLRNHGDNSWNFVELSVTRQVPCDTLPDQEPQ